MIFSFENLLSLISTYRCLFLINFVATQLQCLYFFIDISWYMASNAFFKSINIARVEHSASGDDIFPVKSNRADRVDLLCLKQY